VTRGPLNVKGFDGKFFGGEVKKWGGRKSGGILQRSVEK